MDDAIAHWIVVNVSSGLHAPERKRQKVGVGERATGTIINTLIFLQSLNGTHF